MVFLSVSPLTLILRLRVRKGRRTQRGEMSSACSDPFNDVEFGQNLAALSNKFAAT